MLSVSKELINQHRNNSLYILNVLELGFVDHQRQQYTRASRRCQGVDRIQHHRSPRCGRIYWTHYYMRGTDETLQKYVKMQVLVKMFSYRLSVFKWLNSSVGERRCLVWLTHIHTVTFNLYYTTEFNRKWVDINPCRESNKNNRKYTKRNEFAWHNKIINQSASVYLFIR